MTDETKLEKGMYVRTRLGFGKIINISDYNACVEFSKNNVKIFPLIDINIKKARHNIIDLIEVGDYVNGYKITLINEARSILFSEDETGYLIESFYADEIKSIVTKELFEQMSYKIC